MDFLDLYKIVDSRKYDLFKRKFNKNKFTLIGSESSILNITYLIKRGEFKKAELIISDLLNSNQLEPKFKIVIQVKLFSIIQLIGSSIKTEDLIIKIDNYYKNYDPKDQFQMIIYSDYMNYKGIFFLLRGKMNECKTVFDKALEIDIQLDMPLRVAKTQTNYAVYEQYKGNLTASLSRLYKAKSIQEVHRDHHSLGQTYGNLSEVLELNGDYESAYNYAKKAHHIFSKFNNAEEMASNLTNQARIASILNNFETSNSLFKQAIKIRSENQENTYPIFHAQTLLEYIIFLVSNERDPTDTLLKLKKFKNAYSEINEIELRFEFAQAIINYHSLDISIKISSLDSFIEIEKKVRKSAYLLYRFVIDYLIDILLLNYKVSGSKRILMDIKSHQEKLEDFAEKHNNPELYVKGKLLLIQILVYENKINKAFVFVNDLLQYTHKQGSDYLIQIVKREHRQIEYIYDSDDHFKTNRDIIDSFPNLTNYKDNYSKRENVEIYNIFVMNPHYKILNLYGNPENKKIIISLINLISLPTNLFVKHLNDKIIIVLKKYSTWYGIIFSGGMDRVYDKFTVLVDLIRIKTLFHKKDCGLIQCFTSEGMVEFIDDFIHEEFERSENHLSLLKFKSEKLESFDIFLHPIRLSVMNILAKYFKMKRSELQKFVGGKKSTFNFNLKKLHERGLIEFETEFIQMKPRKMVYVNTLGLKMFNDFTKLIS